MRDIAGVPIGPLAGVAVLAYVAFAKYSEYTFRRSAVAVTAKVAKIVPHRHFTSYFMAYDHENSSRVDEYKGPPMVTKFDVGEAVEILIDPQRRPQVGASSEADDLRPGGECSLKGSAIFGFWDGFYVLVSVGLIAQFLLI
jgi:hypothetical protein